MRSPLLRVVSLAVTGLLTLSLSACAGASDTKDSSTAVLLLPGTTGDGGFFDQASAGLRKGARDAGWEAKTVETGYEPIKWLPALKDVVAANQDAVVITGTFAMQELVEQTAAEFPDRQFVLFDAAADPKKCGGCKNIYSLTYRYDQTGFLAGVLAGLLEEAPPGSVPRLNAARTVGVVGGQDIPVIKEYIAGFKAGVKAVAPQVRVLSAYVGSFADPVKGKAVAEDMIQQGADIVFTAAGATDKGVIEAAASAGVWALGSAAAQARSPEAGTKDAVLTASDTDITTSIAGAVRLAKRGDLPVGTTRTFGVAEGAVTIVDTPLYRSTVPASIRSRVAEVSSDMAKGKYDGLLKAGR